MLVLARVGSPLEERNSAELPPELARIDVGAAAEGPVGRRLRFGEEDEELRERCRCSSKLLVGERAGAARDGWNWWTAEAERGHRAGAREPRSSGSYQRRVSAGQ